MFGTSNRSRFETRRIPAPHDRGHDAGMNRDGKGVSPLLGGVVGTVIQNVIARKVAGKMAARFGGIPGMIVGVGVTYAINSLFNGTRIARR
jgi:hypothetical protein